MKEKLYEVLGDLNELRSQIGYLYFFLDIWEKYYEEKDEENQDVLTITSVSKVCVDRLGRELSDVTFTMDSLILSVKHMK